MGFADWVVVLIMAVLFVLAVAKAARDGASGKCCGKCAGCAQRCKTAYTRENPPASEKTGD